MITNSTSGSGFDAYAGIEDVTEGALYVTLTKQGSGYTTSPIVTLQGGSFDSNVEGRKKPMQITAESPVYLLADASDLDGYVSSVRFYGDGEDLSLRYDREITGIEILNAGSGYTQPPSVVIDGGGGSGATASAILVPPTPTINPVTGVAVVNQNEARPLSSIFVTSPGSGYYAPPNVEIVSNNGNGSGPSPGQSVEEQASEVPAYEAVAGTNRWVLEWIPTKPGTYLIDLEITDLDGLTAFYSTQTKSSFCPSKFH